MKVGVFDSGMGGLTVLKAMMQSAPGYDYVYVGDNARTPYGNRSFDTILKFTQQAVDYLFRQDCVIIIIACNTASAKALRTLQQRYLPISYPQRRILGVIRPAAERLSDFTKTGSVGIWATQGTVKSDSYRLELAKLAPTLKVTQTECPMLVPLIESGELDNAGLDFFINKYWQQTVDKAADIDTLLLACTHYPIILPAIINCLPPDVQVITQSNLIGPSWQNYLTRHPELESQISRGNTCQYLTTDQEQNFNFLTQTFLGYPISAKKIDLNSDY
jgi:glutamate racemase